MTKNNQLALLPILLSCGFSVLLGFLISKPNPGGPVDFQAIYFGARCLLAHHNPYNVAELAQIYRTEFDERAPRDERIKDAVKRRQIVTRYVNLPTVSLLVVPFAAMHLATAQVLWRALSGVMLVMAASLVWNLGSRYSPILSLVLVCFLVANDELAFATANPALIVVPLCVIAAWSFLRNEWIAVGIVCMSLSLAVKPHDAGFIWLYFLLSGAAHRRRALLSLLVTAILAIAASIWLFCIAPGWVSGWRANLAAISARGGLNDPGPASISANSLGQVISLQSVLSVFRDDPRIYNLGSYLLCGLLLLIWMVATLRSAPSTHKTWFAIASVVPITLLITYHRIYDAKLMLLTIPACAILWAGGGKLRWCGAIIGALGVFFVSDIPLAWLIGYSPDYSRTISFGGQLTTVFIGRSTSLALLVSAVFYLLVYVKCSAFKSTTLPWKTKQSNDSTQVQERAL